MESVTETEVVDEAVVPLSVAVPLVEAPYSGAAVTVTVVPVGMLVAAIFTVTGFVVVEGSVTSGEPYLPVGLAGTFRPPIEVIVSVGTVATNTVPG